MGFVYLVIAFILNAGANILLKLGAGEGLKGGGNVVALVALNWQLITGLVLFAANVVFYFLALRALPLSTAYPIMVAATFVLVNGYAILTLREAVTPLTIAGYVLILAGVCLVLARQAA